MSSSPNGNAKHKIPPAPYKGLVPYTEEDAALFFGRDAERSIIVANLRSSRFTLLYGPSGVGKSSVVGAGVVYFLRQRARQNLQKRGTPEFAVVYFNQWRDNPIAGLERAAREAVESLLGKTFDDDATFAAKSLDEQLKTWAERAGGDLLVLLDQFEDYFLYHPNEDGPGTFAYEFPRVVTDKDARVNFLISIREDAVAKLDVFEGSIPTLFDNYIRIDHLDRKAARDAIIKPIEQYNKSIGDPALQVNIEPELVDAVLDEVKAGRVSLTETGAGRIKDGPGGESQDDETARIETPFLQLVMTRLWDEELRAGSHTLRLETLKRLGGAERIVRTHLDNTLGSLPFNERAAAAAMFYYLVTPSGTKIAHTARDLAEYTNNTEQQLTPVLEKMSASGIRILRPVAPPPDHLDAPTRYEIFHDVLAPAMLDWRRRYIQQQQNRRRNRLIAFGSIIGLLAIALIVGTLYMNLQQSQRQLEQKAQEAQSLSEAILAVPQATDNPNATVPPTLVAIRATAAAVGTSSAAVTCQSSPSIRFTTSKNTIAPGEAVTLSWGQASHVTAVSISPDIGKVPLEGSQEVKPTEDTIYTLTATGCDKNTRQTVAITVIQPTGVPTPVPPTATPPPPPPTAAPPSPTRLRPTATQNIPPTATQINAPPGVYVTGMTVDPPNPRAGEPVHFKASFLNTTGGSQTYKWCVYIFNPDDFPRKHTSESTCSPSEIPAGASIVEALPWTQNRLGTCLTYLASPFFIEASGASTMFLKPDNSNFWVDFTICP